MPTVASIGLPVVAFYDDNGRPAFGGRVYTYLAGSVTPATTYTDATGLIPNPNPIPLNERGECTIWYDTSKAYKLAPFLLNGTELPIQDDLAIPASGSAGVVNNFVPTGTGGKTRTVQIMLQRDVSTGSYRLDTDPDDTMMFVRASLEAANRGTAVRVEDGAYNVQPHALTAGIRAMYSSGRGNVMLNVLPATFANGVRMLDWRALTKCDVYGMTVQMDDARFFSNVPNAPSGVFGIDLSGGSAVTLDDFEIIGSSNVYVYIGGGTDIKVKNVRINTTQAGCQAAAYVVNTPTMSAINCSFEGLVMRGGFNYGPTFAFARGGSTISDGHQCRASELYAAPGRATSAFGFSTTADNCRFSDLYCENTGHEAFQVTEAYGNSFRNSKCAWSGDNGRDFAMSTNGELVAAKLNVFDGIEVLNAYSCMVAFADSSQNNIAVNITGKDCGVRAERDSPGQGRVLSAYTVTSGTQCLGNVFRRIKHINEAGPVTNYFAEIQNGGGTTDNNSVDLDGFDGVVTTPAVIVGQHSYSFKSGSGSSSGSTDHTTLTASSGSAPVKTLKAATTGDFQILNNAGAVIGTFQDNGLFIAENGQVALRTPVFSPRVLALNGLGNIAFFNTSSVECFSVNAAGGVILPVGGGINIFKGGDPSNPANYQQLLGGRITGWGTPTGTVSRTPVVVGSGATIDQVLAVLNALILDLRAQGPIGT